MQQYDLIIIGGGPGGYECAAAAAARGRKVALVEKSQLGGTCLNRGCVPTKCLCAAAARIIDLSDDADFGIEVGPWSADFARARSRAEGVISELRCDIEAMLSNVDLYNAEARLGEGHTVIAGADFLKGHEIVIATGARPAPFPAPGGEYVIDSDDFLKLYSPAEAMAIVGGGVIGVEFASVLAAYGVKVTVLEYCAEILPGFDAEVAKRLRTALTRRGIKFITSAKVTGVDASHTVNYEAKGKSLTLECDMVVSAVGRRPVLPEGLDKAGVATDSRGFITVDETYCTSAPGIYAIGDVNGRCMLAHAASAQARIVAGISESMGVIPSVVFSTPECASVGAKVDDSPAYSAVKIPFAANAKAQAEGSAAGLLKLVYETDSRRIAGCQAVGAHAGELIALAAMAIDAGNTIETLAHHSVFAHPGISELIQQAAAAAK